MGPRYPRLGTPAGDRALASAQMAWDNMTPEDVYGADEDDELEEEDEETDDGEEGEE